MKAVHKRLIGSCIVLLFGFFLYYKISVRYYSVEASMGLAVVLSLVTLFFSFRGVGFGLEHELINGEEGVRDGK